MTTPSPFASGYRLTDGNDLNVTIANPYWSTTAAATATSGGTMPTSTKIIDAVTNITSVPTSGAGLTLPQALPGQVLVLTNNGVNDARIFAAGGSTINGSAGTTGIMLAKLTTGIFVAVATNTWIQLNTTGTPGILTGSGAPEGVVSATIGTLYTNTLGGANTTLYVKTSGSGNTGWTAK
jgi:hypothetical protein